MTVRAAALHRYPVKGFPAERMSAGMVRVGSGFDGDRAAALSNGSAAVPGGVWSACGNFSALKNDPSLQAWQVSAARAPGFPSPAPAIAFPAVPSPAPAVASPAPEVRAAEATTPPAVAIILRDPAGAAACFRTDDPVSLAGASAFLTDRLRAQGAHPRSLVVADQGMFDSRVSGVSFINPASVAVLSAASGTDLDPLRFRGNVQLAGLDPFAEFALIGCVVRLGGARLWIRSSIERCPATRVNPVTAEDDVNVPRLLAGHLGHLHCGVYGVVLESGEVAEGDELVIEDALLADVPTGLDPALARHPTSPRFMTVLESAEADAGQVRIRLRDDLGWFPHHYRPGMHVRVHLLTSGGPVWRTYTVTGCTGTELELGVGLDGVGSRALAAARPDSRVLVSGPYGRITPASLTGGHTVFLTAGIGITPALALAPALASAPALGAQSHPSPRRVSLLHVERSAAPTAFFARLAAAVAPCPAGTVDRWPSALRGRPTVADLTTALTTMLADSLPAEADLVVCGPAGFLTTAEAAAAAVGIAPARIHREVFSSPRSLDADGGQDLSAWAAARVRTASGAAFEWTPASGLLLDALESHGIPAPSSCRGGSCGTCVLPLLDGQVAYPVEPAASFGDDEVVTCSAVPDGEVIVGI